MTICAQVAARGYEEDVCAALAEARAAHASELGALRAELAAQRASATGECTVPARWPAAASPQRRGEPPLLLPPPALTPGSALDAILGAVVANGVLSTPGDSPAAALGGGGSPARRGGPCGGCGLRAGTGPATPVREVGSRVAFLAAAGAGGGRSTREG